MNTYLQVYRVRQQKCPLENSLQNRSEWCLKNNVELITYLLYDRLFHWSQSQTLPEGTDSSADLQVDPGAVVKGHNLADGPYTVHASMHTRNQREIADRRYVYS